MKVRTKKICSFCCAGVTLFTLFCSSIGSFIKKHDSTTAENHIEKISDDSIQLSCKGSEDIIFTKTKLGDSKFHYQMSNADNGQLLSSFSSEFEIDLNSRDNLGKADPTVCAAAWAIFKAVTMGGDPVDAAIKVLGASAAFANDTFVAAAQLVCECGVLAIPSIIGLLSTSELLACVGSATAIA